MEIKSTLPNDNKSSGDSSTSHSNCGICAILKPLLFVGQLVAVFPVTQKRGSCRLIHSWKSNLAKLNIVFTVGNTLSLLYFFPKILAILGHLMKGTSLYTYALSALLQITSSIITYGCGNYKGKTLCEALDKLHEVTDEISSRKMMKAKIFTLYSTIYVAVDMILIGFYTYISWQVRSSVIPSVAIPLSIFFSELIPDVLGSTYCALLWIVGTVFDAINEELTHILTAYGKNERKQELLIFELIKLRNVHEKLCRTVGLLQNAFGIQLLALFVGALASSLSAMYTILLGPSQSNSLIPSNSVSRVAVGLTLCAVRILNIIFYNQRAMNSANRSMFILNHFEGSVQSKATRIQVSKFQYKLGSNPLRIRCCDLFEMGMGFLASGASTYLTYILILLQFRQADVEFLRVEN